MNSIAVPFPQNNNFDLIRLFAALQVAITHGYEHFHLHDKNPILDFLVQKIFFYFPGVPIFFVISGFLIFSSFERRKDVKIYYFNRFIRLFPALWVSFFITFCILFFFGFIRFGNLFSGEILAWIIGQITFFQFFTPAELRNYGLGNPNGSLWTIVVEIQFYVFVPVIYYLFNKVKVNRNLFLFVLILISLIVNMMTGYFVEQSSSILEKLIGVTLLPYFFYFLLGALVYYNYERIALLLENKALVSGIVYFAFYIIFSQFGKLYYPGYWLNTFGFLNTVLLVWFIFALTFSNRNLSGRVLFRNDFSYGLYIYHGIVLNFFIQNKFLFNYLTFCVYLGVSLILAFLSWKLVERQALKLKGNIGSVTPALN